MIFVGIDVASKKHDCFLMQDETGLIYSKPFSIDNNEEGYKKLHTAITNFVKQTKDSNVRIGLESTGHYSNNILNYFYKAGFQVALINPLLTNMDRKATSVRKTKTDKVDSQAICMFLQRNKYDFQPYTSPLYHIEALKSLTRQRFQLVKAKSKYKVILNRLITIVFPEYLNLFSDLYGVSSLNILLNYPTPKKIAKAKLSSISKHIHARCSATAFEIQEIAKNSVGQSEDFYAFQIKQAIETILFFNKQIESYEKEISSIIKEYGQVILSIPGVGNITGAMILSEIRNIDRFSSPDKLLTFAGLDPSVYQSGQYEANLKISKRGSKYLRWAIHQASFIIWQHDQTFNDYYHKKINEGKQHNVIIGHIEKKLVRVIYSLLKNNKSFVPQK